MTKDELLAHIRKRIGQFGSQKSFAEMYGVSEGYVSDVLKGRREPGEKLLRALNMRRVVTYETRPGVPGPPSPPRGPRREWA